MQEIKSLPLAVTSFLSSRWHQPCSRLSLALAWRKWHISLGRKLPQAKTLCHPQADLQDLTQREPWWFGLEELGMRMGQITHLSWDLPDPSHSPLPLWAVLMQKNPANFTLRGGGTHLAVCFTQRSLFYLLATCYWTGPSFMRVEGSSPGLAESLYSSLIQTYPVMSRCFLQQGVQDHM